MEKFCKNLKKHATKIINYEKKEMIPLTDKEHKSYENQKVCYICKKGFSTDDNKKYQKDREHCHYTGKFRGVAHGICNLRHKTTKEIPIVFHNGSTYNYHFIIKQLAKESNGQFECLGENIEKYSTFSVPIKKELDHKKLIIYKLKFIASFRFMSTSFSKLVKYLSKRLHSDKFIHCESHLDYMPIEDDQLIFRCFECKGNYKKEFNKDIIKRFASTYEFWNGEINKFILLLRKGVYAYEYKDSRERFDETSLLGKETFYSNLNTKDIRYVD